MSNQKQNLMTSQKKKRFNGEGKRLSDQVEKSMRKYFKELDGEKATNIYKMVLKEVELPLLEAVMKECKGNQTLASQLLGLNRGTLRTKLKQYNLI
ncbi:MAG: DNA-binding transcriptional regulator Fis [Gammaproteobacteria bacterium]